LLQLGKNRLYSARIGVATSSGGIRGIPGAIKDGKVKLDGDKVIEFPKLPEMHQVTLKVLRLEERDKRLVIKDAEVVI